MRSVWATYGEVLQAVQVETPVGSRKHSPGYRERVPGCIWRGHVRPWVEVKSSIVHIVAYILSPPLQTLLETKITQNLISPGKSLKGESTHPENHQ